MSDELNTIAQSIASRRYSYSNEDQLQVALEYAFASDELNARREVEIALGCRIDFVIGRVGVEVKVDSPGHAVARQLRRYLGSDLIDEVLLVTNRERHRDLGTIPFVYVLVVRGAF